MRLILACLLLAVALADAAKAADLPLVRLDLAADSAPPLRPTLDRVLAATAAEDEASAADAGDDERRLARLKDALVSALATEGWFAPALAVEPDREARARHLLRIAPGRRARVESVQISFAGALAADPARVAVLRAGWTLARDAPFRDADWSTAKAKLLERVRERDFAAATLADSRAEVDAEAGTVRLTVEIDSGRAFTLGGLRVEGLSRYPAALVERYRGFAPGDPYDAARLLAFQRELQQSGFFGSVIVEVDAAGPAERAPVRVEVTEARRRRAAIGLGASSDTGARVEGTYRQAMLFDRPYTLSGGASLDRTRAVGFADLLLPHRRDGWQQSVGLLRERTDIEGLRTERQAFGIKGTSTRESEGATWDTLLSLTLEDETRSLADGSEAQNNQVLAGTWTWTRRAVDELTHPTRGDLLTVSATLGLQRGSVGQALRQSFARLYGRYVRWIPLGASDRVVLRGEAGQVFVADVDFVPNEYLFRTGGVNSVRGYRYQSLGVRVGTSTTGSRELLVGSAEWVHRLGAPWSAALFCDVGDAADRLRDVRLARGYGLGARYDTVAGPLAMDLAYGERDHHWRAHFSLAIAF